MSQADTDGCPSHLYTGATTPPSSRCLDRRWAATGKCELGTVFFCETLFISSKKTKRLFDCNHPIVNLGPDLALLKELNDSRRSTGRSWSLVLSQ